MTLLSRRFPKSEAEIGQLVAADDWMMQVLAAAKSMGLPDWWIGAGFLRNRVWDALEGGYSQMAGTAAQWLHTWRFNAGKSL